jgi:uncharacterized membrane protein
MTLRAIRHHMARSLAVLALCGVTAAGSTLPAVSARADFQICNATSSRVGVAIGYKDNDGNWVTEGWWNLPPHACEVPLKGSLLARFYYVYAIDYDNGGEWAGTSYMCTREKEFKIVGIHDCLARGYDRTGFYEIDTGEQRTWTVQFTDAPKPPDPSQTTMPLIPMPPARLAPAAPPGTQAR